MRRRIAPRKDDGRAKEPAVGFVTANLSVEVLAASEAADAELDSFFDNRCETSFAQQTRQWRDVIAPLAGDEPHFLACRAGAAF